MAENNPTYNDSSCTGTPFVLGGARGRRVFYLDADGVLRGVTYRWPWRDGENVAECLVTKKANVMGYSTGHNAHNGLPPFYVAGVVFKPGLDAEPGLDAGYQWDRCEGLDPECACGFYAYHEGETQYALSGPGCRVTGVVEAYGRVVLGTLGYRAEKARILGLVKPPETEATRRRQAMTGQLRDLELRLKAVQAFPNLLVGRRDPRALQVLCALAAVAAAVVPRTYTPTFLFLAGVLAVNAVIFKRVFKAEYESAVAHLEEAIEAVRADLRSMPDDYSEHVEKAMANYPSVRWFNSLAELYEVYPCESLRHLVAKEESDG